MDGSEIFLDFKERPIDYVVPSDLKVLSLRGCCEWVTDEVLDELVSSGCLESVYLFRCWRLSDKGLFNLLKHNGPRLRNLEFSGCNNLSDKTLKHVQRFCPNLKSIDLTRCPLVTDIGLNFLADGCPELESLLLYADSGLSSSSYIAIAQLINLRSLDLCGHENLSAQALVSILSACGNNLEYLNLSWCVNVSDAVLAHVMDQNLLCSIEYLSIFGIRAFSGQVLSNFIEYLCTHAKKLTRLDVRGIPSVSEFSENDCRILRERFPNLVEWKLHH